MKIPKVVVIDVNLLAESDKDTEKSPMNTLLGICKRNDIPVYFVGNYLKVPRSIMRQTEEVFCMRDCVGVFWNILTTKHNAQPCDAFYVSMNPEHRASAKNFGLIPVAVADEVTTHLGCCLGTESHTMAGYVFEALDDFSYALSQTIIAVRLKNPDL